MCRTGVPLGVRARIVPTLRRGEKEVKAWTRERNSRVCKVDWHFTVGEAREKLKRLYPVFSKEKYSH